MEIPQNNYDVTKDPRIDDAMAKCLKQLENKGEAYIWMNPLNPGADDACITGEGNDAVTEEVLRQFAKAGYYCVMYHNGYTFIWAKISKNPINLVTGLSPVGENTYMFRY